jgi:hypothetical protein
MRAKTMGSAAEDDVEVTEEDLAAADELWANKVFPSEEQRLIYRQYSAHLHARWGDHKFRVRYGLRPPSTRLEEIEADYFQGRIKKEQYRENYHAYTIRPADLEMLDELLKSLEQRLDHYGRFLEDINRLVHGLPNASLRRASNNARAMSAKLAISGTEYATACRFLTEARIRRGLSVISNRGFTTPTVVELIWKIVDGAAKHWKTAKWGARESENGTRFAYAVSASQLFRVMPQCSDLPPASELKALLREEHVIGRMALEATASQVAQSIDAIQINLHENGTRGTVAGNDAAAKVASQGPPVPALLSVDAWEDLALAIDKRKRVWAVTPAPADGAVFPKSKATCIPMRKGNPFTLLTALAESSTGRSADIYRVAGAFGLLPPPSSLPRENRSRRHALVAGQTNDLTSKGALWRKKLNQIVSGAAARLREYVMGPVGKGVSALSISEERVTSGFIVRHLVRDENGHLKFGVKPS